MSCFGHVLSIYPGAHTVHWLTLSIYNTLHQWRWLRGRSSLAGQCDSLLHVTVLVVDCMPPCQLLSPGPRVAESWHHWQHSQWDRGQDIIASTIKTTFQSLTSSVLWPWRKTVGEIFFEKLNVLHARAQRLLTHEVVLSALRYIWHVQCIVQQRFQTQTIKTFMNWNRMTLLRILGWNMLNICENKRLKLIITESSSFCLKLSLIKTTCLLISVGDVYSYKHLRKLTRNKNYIIHW